MHLLGLELKGKVETFQQIVRHFQERDADLLDIEFILSQGGEDWVITSLTTHPTYGISTASVQNRVNLFGSNKAKEHKLDCKLS